MPPQIEILFLRHSIKEGDALTPAGIELAHQRGKELKSDVATHFYASSKNRTIQTAKELAHAMKAAGGNVENIGPVIVPSLAYDFTEKEPLPEAIFKFSSEFAQAQKEHGEARAFHHYVSQKFSGIPSVEHAGESLLNWVRHLVESFSNQKEPVRCIVVSHGGTVLDTLFYTLTGKELSEVNEQGGLTWLEGFSLICNRKNVHVLFRGSQFGVTREGKRILFN